MSRRTIQAEGLTLFYLHYWHPIFAAWRARNARCRDRVTDGRADLAAGSRALRCLAGKSLRPSGACSPRLSGSCRCAAPLTCLGARWSPRFLLQVVG
ncbi:Mu transposase C-terminal domain-containing protein [Cupriavidus laharis]|nr:Mu transposase C-terminal domain-containing protein [Cupriavidus laharis]